MSHRTFIRALFILSAGHLFLAGPSQLDAQVDAVLTAGKTVEGSTSGEGIASYRFRAESAGVLTIVVRSMDGTDLVLMVADADGQPLPNGRSDQDLGGDAGAEQFAVTLQRAGEYRIGVETFGASQAAYRIGVSWLPFPELAMPPDPDGSPSSAVQVQVGQDTRVDALDGAKGDYWDWFLLKVEKAGTLTVATRADDGDLILEAYAPGDFGQALERSDQDLQGSGGNEALTLLVEAGEELYFKVSAFSEGAAIPYRMQIGFIEG